MSASTENELLARLNELSLKDKKSAVRAKKYVFNPTPEINVGILSYNIQDYAFKLDDYLPIHARGLFVSEETNRILVRGYDKFFNVGETALTKWEYLQESCVGPYELTLKENGCIIFVASVKGHLLVASKHAFGPALDPSKPSHAQQGEIWLEKHLEKSGATREMLSAYLESLDATAVFELADDEFEEHVLEYPSERRGLYCHGINLNTAKFQSLPTDRVHEFAKKFGFLYVDVLVKDSIQDVKDFSDECAKTGSYKGSPIEGFVVRCHRLEDKKKILHFFKIKFDEPYLMFREWREVTRSVMSGRPVNRMKFGLTEKYVTWAQAKYRQEPHLFKQFNEGKGIIALRNLFLQQVEGLSTFMGPDVIALCKIPPKKDDAVDLNVGKDKVLLVPISTVGSGKTTLARCLAILFPDLIGHVQNDNIQVKKSAPFFEQKIMDLFLSRDYVFADRNNHLFQHRQGICTVFKKEYPGGRIVALDWDITSLDPKYVSELTCARIESRGENHQSLTPMRTKDYRTIVGNFVRRRDALDLEHDADFLINEVVKIDITSSVLENVEKVCRHLGLDLPDSCILDQVFEEACSVKEDVVKEVKQRNDTVNFYGVKIEGNLLEVIKNMSLDCKVLKKVIKPDKSWHMTIAVAKQKGDQLLKEFNARLKKPSQGDELALGARVKIHVDKLIWNDRIAALSISKTVPHVPSINAFRHITLGFLTDKPVKPVESNHLLQDFNDGEHEGIYSIGIKDLVLEGSIQVFFK